MSDFEVIVFLTAALIVSLAISFAIVYSAAWLLWHGWKWLRSKLDQDYDFRYEGLLGAFEFEHAHVSGGDWDDWAAHEDDDN